MTTHREKSDDLLKTVEMGNGRRAEIIGTAVVGVVALVGLLIVGFRGKHIGRNAAALTTSPGRAHSVRSATHHGRATSVILLAGRYCASQ